MTKRLASLAAALLVAAGTVASPVIAQSYNAPAGIAAATAPAGLEGRTARRNAEAARRGAFDDDLTTGSVGRRGFDSSAKAGNAEGNNRVVPNYGTTSGGPAY
ncbi:hypothetical protein ASG40_14420 [Methylobacterium sp. Leaf399]|uniref:hypothetical protein n=1 Tax=Methylobacterium sp. Leaf399 TaxID=1736364 RepID=UPI0006F52261|nr:hypothetical protein [Methylobacterium sp. Leaf399]KQT07542.1 hypothetical protein ASG40_14420 [Methylobacterium sp. Leaf399]